MLHLSAPERHAAGIHPGDVAHVTMSPCFFFKLKQKLTPPALNKRFWEFSGSVHLTAKVLAGVLFGAYADFLLYLCACFLAFSLW